MQEGILIYCGGAEREGELGWEFSYREIRKIRERGKREDRIYRIYRMRALRKIGERGMPGQKSYAAGWSRE